MKRLHLVAILTIASVLLAISIGFLISYVLNYEFTYAHIVRSTVIPIIIAPICSWYLIGLLISFEQMKEKLIILATYDDLTGLLNRRAFYDFSQKKHNFLKQNKRSYSILVVDLDLFKKINDTFGHSAGDKVLNNFGKTCSEFARKEDLVGRLGGEEFGFFLPNTCINEAQEFAKKLLKKINKTKVKYENIEITFTVSIGVSENNSEEDFSLDEVINKADKALFTAKTKGRDQLYIF